MESFQLRHLKRTSTRLLAWLMNDVLQESGVHDYVSEGYQKVSKACQIMTENEEYEREQKGGVSGESSVEASKADEEPPEGLVRVL